MIVLDTAVLVYSIGGDHVLRPPARSLLERIGDGRVRATTTVAVLQEFTHVWARRRGRSQAAAHARRFVSALTPLMRPDADDLERGLAIYETSARLGAFDAVLAAVAIGGEHALVSGDRGFAEVRGLRFMPLDGPDLAALIDGGA